MKHRRMVWMIGVVLAFIALTPATAVSATFTDSGTDSLLYTGSIHVDEGETFETVVSLSGSVVIDGHVGNVISLSGPVIINGVVDETVISFADRATITEGALVKGDVYARYAPDIDPGGVVRGATGRFEIESILVPLEIVSRLTVWIAISASTLALGLMLGLFGSKAADGAFSIARTDTPAVTGIGLAVFFGLPLLGIAITITGIGVPLGVGLLLALALIYGIAYVTGAWLLGRAIVKDPARRIAAFIAGWALLRALALIPFIGGTIWFIAVVAGLGVLTVEAWRARTPKEAKAAHLPSATPA